jgi:putative oxidoreductase
VGSPVYRWNADMLRILFPPFLAGRASIGLLALRLVAGTAMALHGWPKIQNPTSWMPPDAPVPGALQAAAAIAEFGGGVCWVLGLLTPVASFLIACTMAVAAFTVHIPAGHPFVSSTGGPSYEPALGYLAIAISLLLVGPGRLSIDWCLFGRGRGGAVVPEAGRG